MLELILSVSGFCLLLGVAYPVTAVAIAKMCGSKATIRQILEKL